VDGCSVYCVDSYSSYIRNQAHSQLQAFKSNHYRIPILPLSIFAMQNEHGQGVSHAVGDSKVPEKVQEKAPQGLEESLPNRVRV